MALKSFKEFLAQRESSAFTRTRKQAMLGLGPDIPDASTHSRSTCDPTLLDYKEKRKKKKKGKKKKKKMFDESSDESLNEAKTPRPVNKQIDKWLDAVDGLKKDVDELDDAPDEDEDEIGHHIPRDADELEDLEDEIGGLEDDVEDLEDDIDDQEDDMEDAAEEGPKSFQSWMKNKDKTPPIDA